MPANLLTTYRQPVWSAIVYKETGSIIQPAGGAPYYAISEVKDISADIAGIKLSFTDEVKAHTAQIDINNNTGQYDLFGSGADASDLAINNIVVVKKGFVQSGTTYLYPAFVGRIISTQTSYKRDEGQIVTIQCGDLFVNSVKHLFTSVPFYNTQINQIITNIVEHYGDTAIYSLANYLSQSPTNLFNLNKTIPYVTFPVMNLLDSLSDLVDIPIFQVWCNYSGQVETFPKLGTAASGTTDQQGWPDASSAPTPDFTFPDAALIAQIDHKWQQYSFTNCVKVYGQELAEQVALGPIQLLCQTPSAGAGNPNYAAAGSGTGDNLDFSSGSGNNAKLSATNVYLKITDPSFNNDMNGTGDVKYIATTPGLYTIDGESIDAFMLANAQEPETIPRATWTGWPVSEIGYSDYPPGQQKVVSFNSAMLQEGGIALLYPTLPAGALLYVYNPAPVPTSLQSVTVGTFANSDNTGFEWSIEVYGQPLIIQPQTLTAIASYQPQSKTEYLHDAFGDHQTYQGTYIPWDLGSVSIIEVKVNPASLPSTTLNTNAVPTPNNGVIVEQTISVANNTGFTLSPGVQPSSATVNVVAIDTNNATAYGTTLTTADVAAGSTAIDVASATGYLVGNPITIGTGSNSEINIIAGVSETTITLVNSLVFAHVIGETIYAPTTREYVIVTGSSGSNTLAISGELAYAHMSGAVVYGLNAALSGDSIYQSLYCHADWESGQLIFDDQVYNNYSADSTTSSSTLLTPWFYATGGYTNGTGSPTTDVFSTQLLISPAPEVVYQTRREVAANGLFSYTFNNLTPGLGYKIRCHFADPTSTAGGERQFYVAVNGVWDYNFIDIWTDAGQAPPNTVNLNAYIKEFDGAVANAQGLITIAFANGTSVQGISNPSNAGGPCCSGIEVVPPQGSGGVAIAINCGGPAEGPTPQTTLSSSYVAGVSSIVVASATGMVAGGQLQLDDNSATTVSEVVTIANNYTSGTTIPLASPTGYAHASAANVYVLPLVEITYGYSPVQQTMGIVSHEINDPLIATFSDALARAQYEVNRSSWARYQCTLVTASIPNLIPGNVAKWFNPRIGASGTTFWGYVQAIVRSMERKGKTIDDHDEYSLYILYAEAGNV